VGPVTHHTFCRICEASCGLRVEVERGAVTEMYGFPFVQPFPDLARSECLIVVGANPAVSKWRPRGREDELSQVRLPMRTLADLMPGVVALPHGWGHQHAKGLRVAQRTRSVNVNLLAADGADALERSSGMARLTAIEVEVSRATGPQDSTSWSGLAAVS